MHLFIMTLRQKRANMVKFVEPTTECHSFKGRVWSRILYHARGSQSSPGIKCFSFNPGGLLYWLFNIVAPQTRLSISVAKRSNPRPSLGFGASRAKPVRTLLRERGNLTRSVSTRHSLSGENIKCSKVEALRIVPTNEALTPDDSDHSRFRALLREIHTRPYRSRRATDPSSEQSLIMEGHI